MNPEDSTRIPRADGESQTLRALVEMLVEAGTLDRADYIKRVRGDGPP